MSLGKPDYYNAVVALVGEGVLAGGKSDGPMSEIFYVEDSPTLPTEAEVQAKLATLIADWDALEYARSRKIEYDALNQLELISDDTNNGTTTHIDAVNAIKTKYPKPE